MGGKDLDPASRLGFAAMILFATGKIALRALGRNKLRSVLTALGIIIGVAAVISMIGIGNGAKAQVAAQVASLGQNVIMVYPASSSSSSGVKLGYGSSVTLTIEDAEAIEGEIPDVIAVSPELYSYAQVIAGNQNWKTKLYGESPSYFEISNGPSPRARVFLTPTSAAPTRLRSSARLPPNNSSLKRAPWAKPCASRVSPLL